MCIIAVKPKNVIITRDTLRRCFDSNSDGAGFVVTKPGGGLTMQKGFFTFDAFWDAYERHAKETAVIHFRIKTHGNKDAEMCHPFRITDDLYVAHNGIINISTEDDPTKSDTWHFTELVLKPELARSQAALHRPAFQYLLSCTIGGSKLAFLNSAGKTVIINKDKGEMDGEVWYSNTSFRATRAASYSGGGCYGGWMEDDWGSRYHTGGRREKKQHKTGHSTNSKPSYDSLDKVPVSEQWAIDILRKFAFSDDDILNEVNADTAESLALDLMVEDRKERKEREAISAELAEASSAAEEALAVAADSEEAEAVANAS